ncbi:alpha-2-macroglobulin [Cellulophaga sp. Hel_I_12]|uniref:alpha-2-macroglobulin family protein n=1 Tax=Cellulophaga sp. Hel_I_12 TaxID=1249972 RepID=UPI000646217B|nr:MG2 domain-containing protein [Cellulophaga sp. Hel_I_12]
MKTASLLIALLICTQLVTGQENSDSYEVLWKQVAQFDTENLPKSAQKVVGVITEKARKEKNTPQLVKSLIYASKYTLTLEEEAQLSIINDFKSEIEKAELPTKNILESYLANLYWQYFQQNRYLFYNRTETAEKVDSTDFRTWDLTTLFNEISIHFEASLQNSAALQKIKVSDFDVILNQQKNSEKYRPTLYDLLAHTALNFYKTSENSITRPAAKFEIDRIDLLCEGYQFIQKEIKTTDETSLQAKALLMYQELLKFHTQDTSLEAYTAIDIERLQFIKENATFADKELQYISVLKNSAEQVKTNAIWGLYQHEIAAQYQQWGMQYEPKHQEEYRWKLKEALEVSEAIILKYPESVAAEKSKSLIASILSKELRLTNETYIPINEISKLLIQHKNIDLVSLTAYKSSPEQLEKLNNFYDKDEKIAFIKSLKPHKNWSSILKNEGDHQSHRSEVAIPELKNGYYILVATSNPDAIDSFAYSGLQVTNMALVESQNDRTHTFQVIDRTNGKPIAGASLQLNYRINYDKKFLSKTFTADAKGQIHISKSLENWTEIKAKVSYAKETALFSPYYINSDYTNNPSKEISYSCFLFTDRSMYRPGQALYFKGIAVSRTADKQAVSPNTTVIVSLYDTNGQEVAQQTLKTNAYGSFASEFMLPNNGLTGNYSLRVNSTQVNINGYTSFTVEEYKRPKFEATFLPVTETYKVNDVITVKGKALAYAGSTITDAKVSYRVKRVVNFPRWYYWYRPYFNSTPQEITFGDTTTDGSGEFKIDFKALPDTSTSATNLPTFSYEVTADITDLNGETHSASTTVHVGYHALTASIEMASSIDKDNPEQRKLRIGTYNLNGQFVGAKGTLKVYKLKAPNDVLRPRVWAAPDYDTFGEEKFKTLFPHDAHNNEHDSNQWEKEKLVWETTFDTETSQEVKLPNLKKWRSGKYMIELETKDTFGQIVEEKAQTRLFSDSDKFPADNELFTMTSDKTSYGIGDTVILKLSSAAKDLLVTVSIEKDREIIETKIVKLSRNSETLTIPVHKEDIGGFAVNYSFSAFNYFQSNSLVIPVPYPSTDLEVETLTFRDQLQPGTDETWSFKIKGAKGDQVTAELLASMYDASLDAFKPHNWNFHPLDQPYYYSNRRSNATQSYGINGFRTYWNFGEGYYYKPQYYDAFDWFGLQFGNSYFAYGRARSTAKNSSGAPIEMELAASAMDMENDMSALDETVVVGYEVKNDTTEKPTKTDFDAIKIRKNLQETAFFFPQLQTDAAGNVSFSFTTPEALSRWKLQLVAHTKDLQSATRTLQTVTQKELMLTPNAPRFLREGDTIIISSKIANLTDKILTGAAKLVLTDALTNKEINSLISGGEQKEFRVDASGNTQVSWTLNIPKGLQAVQYTIVAKAGDFSDGEQNVLPVLTNRMLVTESLPMWVRSNQTKTFSLDKLQKTTSTSLSHHTLTLEVTSNPAWYAVQALPYLMEYPYECNEQTFARYYANSLASYVANSNPRIQEVFNQWASSGAMLSNLEKNEELKSLLIQETPWLRDAQSETEQKKRIALLFNLNKMNAEQATAMKKLEQNQLSSGAWAWFAGGKENRYITQHMVTGLGHLDKLTSTQLNQSSVAEQARSQMIINAISYLDAEFIAEYEYMKKRTSNINNDHLSTTQVHYLYMRSFFKDLKPSKKVAEIITYYQGQAQKYWKKKDLYTQGMLSLVLYRMNDTMTAKAIIKSLDENSITSEALGMYWKENTSSWYWYQAPIETQSLLIEAFSEIQNDLATIDNLKIWLLKNKQTNQWKTTKATTEAVYALLLQGSDWLSVTDAVEVLVGGEKINSTKLENVKVEAGTGYYKTSWNKDEIKPKMGEIQMSKKGNGIAWGALYWQYFEDLDKITSAETPLKLKKKLFLKKNTATGEQISEITAQTKLKLGDVVRVRIELRADRDMEFIHMKDMRAAGFEPINVLSRYKWQDGLGYYESTKDASTNFFFDDLPKGVYVFEYDVRVNNAGDFSNGITTIQSMYAPEFSSHSEGIRVHITTE